MAREEVAREEVVTAAAMVAATEAAAMGEACSVQGVVAATARAMERAGAAKEAAERAAAGAG